MLTQRVELGCVGEYRNDGARDVIISTCTTSEKNSNKRVKECKARSVAIGPAVFIGWFCAFIVEGFAGNQVDSCIKD